MQQRRGLIANASRPLKAASLFHQSVITNHFSWLGRLQHEIKVSEAALIGVMHVHQQVSAEEEIRGIARFAGEIELGRENRARWGL